MGANTVVIDEPLNRLVASSAAGRGNEEPASKSDPIEGETSARKRRATLCEPACVLRY